MAIGDIFKSKKTKSLEERVQELESMLSPEYTQVMSLNDRIAELQSDYEKLQTLIASRNEEIASLNRQAAVIEQQIAQKREQVVLLDDEILMQSFGLYTPQYAFSHSDIYKDKLKIVREEQKLMIKKDTAVTGNKNWTVNGSTSQGQKMVRDMQKLLLRAFNTECDEIIAKVKFNNFESAKKRIDSSCDAISKLGTMMTIAISDKYRQKKIEELALAYEYAQKKQEEKEEQKRIREQLREEQKLQKEIEEERKRLQKEQTHYSNALAKVNQQLQQDPNNTELLTKKQELEDKVNDAERAIKNVDYREANKRAGYVYVISNIGAFGEGVYKIGMTRRLDPQDRVDELGDASVPFNFDVHAMIFTDDAPKLESALHKAFEDRKVNMVNHRREFFRVSLEEVKRVIRENYDKTVEFTDIPDAEQFRISERMRSPGYYAQSASPSAVPVPAATPTASGNPSVSTPAAPSAPEPQPVSSAPSGIQGISSEVQRIAAEVVSECRFVEEDRPDCLRIHIYTTGNQKVGIVKIMKSDLSVRLRKIANGVVSENPLSSIEELKNMI